MSPYIESSDDIGKAKLPDIGSFLEKLMKQWELHGSLIIAVDFDDTIHNYSNNPKLDFKPLIDLLRECHAYNMKIVIYTARPKEDFPMIADFCKKANLPIAAINANLVTSTNNNVGTSGKIYYNLLLDDKAGLQQAYYILRMLYMRIKKTLNGD